MRRLHAGKREAGIRLLQHRYKKRAYSSGGHRCTGIFGRSRNRAAAEAAKSATGSWSKKTVECGCPNSEHATSCDKRAIDCYCGSTDATSAKSYTAVLSYAVMRPGDRLRVHTHPGPEGWYMIVGEQCLRSAGANRAKAGGTMTVPPNVPMELSITGTVLRKSLVLVIHDSSEPRGTPSLWKPSGGCSQ